MMPGHARIHQPEVAVRAPAEQRHRPLQLVGVLVTAGRVAGRPWSGDQQPWVAGESAPLRPRQVAGRQPDLATFDGRAPDDSGPDPERARGHVGHPFEPHPHRAYERVALFLGIVPGEVGQLDTQALGVHVEALVIALGQLDDKIVWHQGAPLGHDGGPVVHLTLDRARHLDRLQLGPEGAREGTLYHAFKTTLEALQNSQRATSLHVPRPRWYPGRGSARGRANLLVAQGGWRNGRRARFRSVCPKGREGSNPSSPTHEVSAGPDGRAGTRYGTTITGQRAWRASHPETEPATRCQMCFGAPITSASALNSSAAAASSLAGLPRLVRTWTSTSACPVTWSSSASSQRSSASASRGTPTTCPVSGSQ